MAKEKTVESKITVYEELESVVCECSKPDWDGYDAVPVLACSVKEARRFLELLPSHIPSPGVVPEPTGHIGLEWYQGKYFTFVASFDGQGTIVYAGSLGEETSFHGTAVFLEAVPNVVIKHIEDVCVSLVFKGA